MGKKCQVKDKTGDDGDPREESVKKLIQSTVEYLIQRDEKELLELTYEFRTDIGEDFLDIVLELEDLVDVYLFAEFIDNEPED